MKVHIVFTESGTIYSVRKSKIDAIKDKEYLEGLYGIATIKEFPVQEGGGE